MIPSMSRPANPYDNASCESLREDSQTGGDSYERDTATFDHLREHISGIHRHLSHNRVRLHSALGYKPPEEFEQAAHPATISQGATK